MVLSLRTIFRFIQWKDYKSSPSLDWERRFADVFLLETEMEQLDEVRKLINQVIEGNRQE